MSTIATTDLSVEAIDSEIEGGFRNLVFGSALECFYENKTKRYRETHLIRALHFVGALYSLLMICDFVLMPDLIRIILATRLAVFMPVFFGTWFVLNRQPSEQVREGMSGLFVVISVGLTMWVVTMSQSDDVGVYVYMMFLGIIYVAVVQRLRFRYAAATIACVVAIEIIACAHLRIVTPRAMIGIIFFYLIGSSLAIWAAYVLEWEQRRSYLLELRSQLLNEHLEHVAKHDPLTGLSNRRHLEARTKAIWTDAAAHPRSMAVIILDIDHFKAFNDFSGHLAGDVCLMRVGECVRIVAAEAGKATAVRYGGEEFLVFADGADFPAAIRMAQEIRALIRKIAIPHEALGAGAIVTASYGISAGDAPAVSMEELVSIADDCLYAAKRTGRDRICPSVTPGDPVSLVA